MTPTGIGGSDGLKKGYRDNMDCEILTWINIFGVPVRFQSDENYSKIVGAFGKAIDTYSNWDSLDVSTGHVCILTKSLRMINEEIEIVYGNTSYRVGVVEFDRDWSPFDAIHGDHHWFKQFGGIHVDSDDDTCLMNSSHSKFEVGNDDAVSATWENPNQVGEVPKEGEIVEEPELDGEVL